MRLNLRDDLAFVTATLVHEGSALTVIDTGAASSVFNADIVAEARPPDMPGVILVGELPR